MKTITTPEGKIDFMALARPVQTYDGKKEVFKIRLLFDASLPAVQELKKQLDEIDPDKVVTKKVPQGWFAVNLQSQFRVPVLDENGKELETVPRFDGRTDTGSAIAQARVDTRGRRNVLHLTRVELRSLNLAPREQASTPIDSLRAGLREASK